VETDYRSATGLELKRTYNSLGTDKSLLSGAFGTGGWRLDWQRSIKTAASDSGSQLRIPLLGSAVLAPYGTTVKRGAQAMSIATAPTITVANAVRGGGEVYTFNKQANGTWTSDPDVNDKLSAQYDSWGYINGWSYTTTDNSVEHYDGMGHLLSVTDRIGQTITLNYSDGTATSPNGGYTLNADGALTATVLPAGLLIRITDAHAHSIKLGYDAQSRIVKMTDPATGVYNYAYDSNGNLILVTYPDGYTKHYLYENVSFPHALTGIIDENASRFATYAYDTNGRAISTEHAGGAERVAITYNTGSSNLTDARGTVRTQTYQVVQGVLKAVGMSQPGGSGCFASSNNMTYDVNGNPATSLDFNGNKTTYSYDLTRNLETSRTEGLTAAGAKTPATRTITITWHPTYRLPQTITEQDTSAATAVTLRVTTLGYDTSGNLLSKSVNDPVANTSRSWTYTYNTAGQVLTADGPRTDVSDLTSYTYDVQGNLASVTNALSQTTTLGGYDANGRPGTITDANGLVTSLNYDVRGRLTSRTAGAGTADAETTSYSYDGVGQLTGVTTPSGATYTYTYDAAHRLTDITDNLGNTIHYTLDAMGNRTQEQTKDALGNVVQTHSRTFDALNRLWKDIGALNQTTTYAYDANGNLTGITDPLNRTTSNSYDALNRLIGTTDAASGITSYGYDGLDQLRKVTDPSNLITQYQRDGLGNLNQQTSPDTGITSNTFDAAGNLQTRTDAKAQQANYSYDALNRVTGVTFTGFPAQSISYQYDQGANGIGHLTQITDVTGTTSYAYDQHGRLASQTVQTHGASYTTDYGYDTQGRLSNLTYPSGRVVSYLYDTMGHINQIATSANSVVQVVASNISYEPFGGVHSFTFGDGLTAPVQSYIRSRDQDGRIASYTLNGKTMSIGYDLASQLTSVTDPTLPLIPANYGYDALSRLSNYTQDIYAQNYSYDADGNRTSLTKGSTTTYAYSPASNRLASIQVGAAAPQAVTQDANGATTSDGARQYSYDARGRLLQTTTAQGVVNYEVNALGLRTRKQAATANTDTLYHYDAQGHLIAESPTGSPGYTREYIYLNDLPVAVMK
jgi:YD repeat-containing protein